ncbi:unnamed protein product [Tilletia controversa]|uniref:NAD(P)-binding protein n=3 Tax=Tilletia TaxID=13289 RepID=A0A8X7SXA3_9BASI|nr:hypothetical protein CF336_g3691 [Tilletia laevis]KAE8198768.1 hypothetical protein CF328_g3455 [Tilletia controversa]KAE8261628.1 hypothetical protein A4X03_0g3095 [Tilletia caries]KAE8203745.1 hypothetical protein CF335_g2907 [Tilletia laevis]KAE8248122.1 hypothetical protein A4X06_0g3943 [Tilletia controversa]
MVSTKELTNANKDVNLDEQRAVVAGGTQGIGAGIALRFAKAGAEVWIIGRNEDKAAGVLEQLKKASEEHAAQQPKQGSHSTPHHEFFKADLSQPKDMDRVAAEIAKRAGDAGVDHLIECQGGPPTGAYKPLPHSEFAFSVQCLSRFRIAERLLQSGTIKQSVLFVAVPGAGGKTLDVDDVDFKKKYEAGRWWSFPLGLVRMGTRDSAVLDCVAQSLAQKYPKHNIVHLFPGIVATDAVANVGYPWPIPLLARTFAPLVARRAEDYAQVPFYLLANPAAKQRLQMGQANNFGPTLSPYELSTCAKDESTREALWTRLESFFTAA